MTTLYRFSFAILLVLIAVSAVESSKKLHSKIFTPICDSCVDTVKKIEQLVEDGWYIEAIADKFCKEEVPFFMVYLCEKVIVGTLEEIFDKLKNLETAEKICADIFLCSALKQYYFLETK